MQKIEVNYIAISTHKKNNIVDTKKNIIRVTKENIINDFFKILDDNKIENVIDIRDSYMSKGKIIFKNQKYEYCFNIDYKNQTTYFLLRTERKPSNKIAENTEELCNIIEDKLKNKYIMLPTNNGVSEYYCNMLYDKINKFDRQLRQLLYNIYIKSFGKEYTNYIKENLPQENIDKINRKMQNGSKIHKLSQFLYNLEYSDIEKILFTPRWTEEEENERKKLLDECLTLEKIEIQNMIYLLKPKSDWERLFEKKCKINMDDKIRELREYRNIVAHSKLIKKEQYDKCNKLINDMNNKVNMAIQETLLENFLATNMEVIIESFKELLDSNEQLKIFIEEIKKMLKHITNLKHIVENNGVNIGSIKAIAEYIENQKETE